MRLDMSTAEIVAHLRAKGFVIHSPVIAKWDGEVCRIDLRGDRCVVVTRGEDRKIRVRIEDT